MDIMEFLKRTFFICLLLHTVTKKTCTSTVNTDRCVSDCSTVMTGDYQSCYGCNVYVTCVGSVAYDMRPCPGQSEWDDDEKRCVRPGHSKTCITGATEYPPTTPGGGGGGGGGGVEGTGTLPVGQCVTTCEGLRNGDYQSCHGCTVFAKCNMGTLWDNLPCAYAGDGVDPLQWDDRLKACVYNGESTTCPVLIDVGDNTTVPAYSDCTLRTETIIQNLTFDGCTAQIPLTATSCVGYCGNTMVTYHPDGRVTYTHDCCSVKETGRVDTIYECPDMISSGFHTYEIILACGNCEPCQ